MLRAEARRDARSQNGVYVPFYEQDPSVWDHSLIASAEGELMRASRSGKIGRYQIEAAIQSALAQKAKGHPVDWTAIARFSDALVTLTRSSVAIVNHAAALLKIDDIEPARKALDIAATDPRMATYQPYWATRLELCRTLVTPKGNGRRLCMQQHFAAIQMSARGLYGSARQLNVGAENPRPCDDFRE